MKHNIAYGRFDSKSFLLLNIRSRNLFMFAGIEFTFNKTNVFCKYSLSSVVEEK